MKLFLFCALLFSAPALGADRVFQNPDSNGDVKIKVNVGGTPTDALKVTGTTAAITAPVSIASPFLRALSTNNTNYVEHKAAASLAANFSYIWPGAAATGALLTTSNSTGTLAWLDVGTSSQVLHGGTTPAWSAITSSDIPTTLTGKTIDQTSTLSAGITATSFTVSGNMVTLPATATTLVGLAGAQTISGNKTLSGTTDFTGTVNKSGNPVYLSVAARMTASCSGVATQGACPSSVQTGIAGIRHTATGMYAVDFTTNFWASAPICVVGTSWLASGIWCGTKTTTPSTSLQDVECDNASGVATEGQLFSIVCTGVRN